MSDELEEREMKSKKAKSGNETDADVKASIKSKIVKNASKEGKKSELNKLILIPIPIAVGILVSWYYNQWLAGLVNTPLNEPKIVDEAAYLSPENQDRYWGTYRSNLYFGLKTRSPNPLNVGMMWFNQFTPNLQMRHWCDQNDRLIKYGWIAHDGRNFGIHDIYETAQNAFLIRNSWAKRYGGRHGGEWSVRTNAMSFGNQDKPQFVSIIFYVGAEQTGWMKSAKKKPSTVLEGETAELGKFKLKIDTTNNNENAVFINQATGNISITHLKDSLIQNGFFERVTTKSETIKEYIGLKSSQPLDESNFIAYQVSGFLPFQFELIFESESYQEEFELKNNRKPEEFKGSEFDSELASYHAQFSDKFDSIFQIKEKNYSAQAQIAAQSALSNLLGGIGFFTGQSIVQSLNNKEPVLYWPANLYTAVPSRSFFPRGFLWDEGFHNLLISQWDLEISRDILAHWLDLMNIEGWIPREVILGEEARAKVPHEFWVQNNQYANPPTLFLPIFNVIHKINQKLRTNAENLDANNADLVYLNRVFKRLKHWYNWFNSTQAGKTQWSYRWRGRLSESKTELNPKTLTSGLDDYPRASHPNEMERHLDLRCWITWASKVMADLVDIIGKTKETEIYRVHYDILRDNKILDELHWASSQYADFGLHSDRVKLVRQKPTDERTPPQSMPMVRLVEVEPSYQFVESFGYVSLFPMLLEIIEPDSPKLGVLLDKLRDPKHLWTNYGLRSLSKSAPLYEKRNTEHDPPYWRGPIWININYLTLKSLKHYSSVDGPHKEKAAKIYGELRAAVVGNILRNYETTGYIWEQYNDMTGRGQGSHPFTGWSSLLVLMMAEIY